MLSPPNEEDETSNDFQLRIRPGIVNEDSIGGLSSFLELESQSLANIKFGPLEKIQSAESRAAQH